MRAVPLSSASKSSQTSGKALEIVPRQAQVPHPENPTVTWYGRGRQPKWIKEALANGKRLEKFLIGGERREAVVRCLCKGSLRGPAKRTFRRLFVVSNFLKHFDHRGSGNFFRCGEDPIATTIVRPHEGSCSNTAAHSKQIPNPSRGLEVRSSMPSLPGSKGEQD
ncbi:H-NS histone family protein [Vannielia litorea]|uniref:H-NS histone family protein n=1 Tax=Vannielia litorea TaxID=1217970 RepID=UPI0031400F77